LVAILRAGITEGTTWRTHRHTQRRTINPVHWRGRRPEKCADVLRAGTPGAPEFASGKFAIAWRSKAEGERHGTDDNARRKRQSNRAFRGTQETRPGIGRDMGCIVNPCPAMRPSHAVKSGKRWRSQKPEGISCGKSERRPG
jgi:hypothetical protein